MSEVKLSEADYAFLYHDTLDKLTALTAEHEAEKTELEKKMV